VSFRSALRPPTGLLCQPRVIYDGEEMGGMIGRGNRSTRRKPASVPICPPKAHMLFPETNPGRRDGKPATNRLRYGTALNGVLPSGFLISRRRQLSRNRI
jgi:hypothetical protein